MGLDVIRTAIPIQNRTALISNLQSLIFISPWSLTVMVIILTLSLAALPFIERTWRATGDEPHYLLAAHSLVADGDFDLSNNYTQLDYLNFYLSKDIIPQIRFTPGGQQILDHQLGLPLLLAPAYAWAGRLGVLAWQVVLGAFLAAIAFKLALLVSQDYLAACLATLFVMLSPPLFLYQYLVYPELIGALLTTLVLYLALKPDRSGRLAFVIVLLSLAALPWLNRRFVPLAIMLALLITWSWRDQRDWLLAYRAGFYRFVRKILDGSRGFSRDKIGVTRLKPQLHSSLNPWAIIMTIFSLLALFWFNNRLFDPTTADITAPTTAAWLWERVSRGIGWLVDQQRGLFMYAPIYMFALWGVPVLIAGSWRERNRHWWVLLPFLLSLGVTTVAGGFWVAWEVGPRFLVVALPALAPLLALAWRHYRSLLWRGLALALFGLSLGHTLVIIQNPELPYKSSLPLYYGDKLGLPLIDYWPDLAGFEPLTPKLGDNFVGSEAGQPVWQAEPGLSTPLVHSGPLPNLPFGHYRLTWTLRTEPNLPPETELVRLAVKVSGGGQIFNHTLTAAELPRDGSYGQVSYSFLNSNVDRWRTPLVFSAISAGTSHIWAKGLLFEPDPFYAGWLPYLALLGLIVAALLTWRFTPPSLAQTTFPPFARHRSLDLLLNKNLDADEYRFGGLPQKIFRNLCLSVKSVSKFFVLPCSITTLLFATSIWSLAFILPLAGFGWVFYQAAQPTRTYEAATLNHFVGRAVSDSQADDGQTWLVDPRIDPPQKAVYGPFDFYDPGVYRVTFRIKLPEAVEAGQEVARLQVAATTNFDSLIIQPLRSEHFAQANLYHDFVLTVTNPRRQALSFEVYYLGVAPLVIDQVSISPEQITTGR